MYTTVHLCCAGEVNRGQRTYGAYPKEPGTCTLAAVQVRSIVQGSLEAFQTLYNEPLEELVERGTLEARAAGQGQPQHLHQVIPSATDCISTGRLIIQGLLPDEGGSRGSPTVSGLMGA